MSKNLWYGYQQTTNVKSESVGTYIHSRNSFESKQFKFNLNTCEAVSYDWWVFVLKVGNTIYFNDASYSMQTSGHQYMARNILKNEMPERFGIKVKNVYIREGLNKLDLAIKNREFRIEQLREAIASPRSWKSTNHKRREEIKTLEATIKEYKRLMPIFNSQIASNQAKLESISDIQTAESRKKTLIINLRANSEKRLVLRDSSYIAVNIVAYDSPKDLDSRENLAVVMSFREYLDCNLFSFWNSDAYSIESITPIDGKTQKEAIKNLDEKKKVEFFLKRIENPQAILTKVKGFKNEKFK